MNEPSDIDYALGSIVSAIIYGDFCLHYLHFLPGSLLSFGGRQVDSRRLRAMPIIWVSNLRIRVRAFVGAGIHCCELH